MNILVIGTVENLNETKLKFGESHRYGQIQDPADAKVLWRTHDVVFDFEIEKNPNQIKIYSEPVSAVVFLNTVVHTLHKLVAIEAPHKQNTILGFCGMPTFLNREILEVSVDQDVHREKLSAICKALGTKFEIVADRVGMVTARVICMIINEAYCTVEEGIASRQDIDKAMILGTNYPQGPFAWTASIGVKNVGRLLQALHQETGDDRYRISDLLKHEAEL